MTVYFGFDCSQPAPDLLPTVRARYGLVDWIGRYLWEIPGVSSGLTVAEVGAIHAAGPAILLIDNGVPQGSLGGSYADGYDAGRAAGRKARTLGAARGRAIVLDVEAASLPSEEEIRGYLDGARDEGAVGGLYLNGLEQSHAQPYLAAIARTSAPSVIYSSEPEFTSWWDSRKMDWYDFAQTPLAPAAGRVGFHQYGENELAGSVDLDACNDYGWRLLWHATPLPPPPPPPHHVDPGCDLKAADPTTGKPDHNSPAAIDPKGRPVHLEQGADVVPVGNPVVTDDRWQKVRLPSSVVWGWVPERCVKAGI